MTSSLVIAMNVVFDLLNIALPAVAAVFCLLRGTGPRARLAAAGFGIVSGGVLLDVAIFWITRFAEVHTPALHVVDNLLFLVGTLGGMSVVAYALLRSPSETSGWVPAQEGPR